MLHLLVQCNGIIPNEQGYIIKQVEPDSVMKNQALIPLAATLQYSSSKLNKVVKYDTT